MIKGRMGVSRQIDVAMRSTIVGYDVLVIIECKNYSKPVSIGTVDELIGKMQDVEAQGAILLSDSGFTEGALKRAEKEPSIQLCSVVDSSSDEIRSKIQIPIKVTFSNLVGNYTPAFQLVRTQRFLGKGGKQFNPKLQEDIDFLYKLAKRYGRDCLYGFYYHIHHEAVKLPAGVYTWTAEVEKNEDYVLIFKCLFEKSHRTFKNDNIYYDAKGIYDHLKKRLVEGKWKPFELVEEDIIESWLEIEPEYTTEGQPNHFMRVSFYNESEIDDKTELMLKNIKNGHLIDLSEPPYIP